MTTVESIHETTVSHARSAPPFIRANSDTLKVPTCKTIIDLASLKGTDDLAQVVFQIAQELFPGWAQQKNDITIHRISGALTNAVFFIDSRGKRRLLRVYGVGVDQLVDREKELAWLARLGRLNLGPRLLGIFGNGRLEEYVDSVTLTHQDIREPTTSQQIAQCVARQHAIIRTYPPPTDTLLPTCEVWKNVDKWYSLVMRLLPGLKQQHPEWAPILDNFNFEQLGKDIEKSKEILSLINSPLVFAHNDLQYGNILKRDDTGSLVLVDFEYSGYNPRGYDLANHFVEWRYDYHGETPAAMTEPFPTKDEQTVFIQAYIDTNTNELGNHDGSSVEEIRTEMEAWLMGTHVGWGLWGLVQASQSQIDFDYFAYSMERLSVYRESLVKWSV